MRSLPKKQTRSLFFFYCANADAGCNWTGPVNTLQVHLQQCKSRLEICPNGCSEKIANSQADKHISEECPYRKVVCEHCNRQITFIRKEEHFDACPQFPVRCPNNCSTEPQEMLRNMLINFMSRRRVESNLFNLVGLGQMRSLPKK